MNRRFGHSAAQRAVIALLCAAGSGIASAGTIAPCGGDCTWSIAAGGVQVASGAFQVDPGSGDINLQGPVKVGLGGGAWAEINGISGNSDPILGFNLSANTGANARTFSFTFSLPIALSGLVDASSSVSYSLTSQTATGAQISPLRGHVVTAQDVDTTVNGLAPLNKGVDVGDGFFFTGQGTKNSGAYTAENILTGNPAYDLMSVTLGFSLTRMSNLGVSGFVQQTTVNQSPVPLPATVWLLGSVALLGWAGMGRGRSGFAAVSALINRT
jgi:hypothetical protein